MAQIVAARSQDGHFEDCFAKGSGRRVMPYPIKGEEMFIARCERFLELAMAEGSPQRAYDGLMA